MFEMQNRYRRILGSNGNGMNLNHHILFTQV